VDVRIGDLKKRIELQSPVNTADGMGGITLSWTSEAYVWAAVWPVSANETIAAGGNPMTISHRIRIRYRSDITNAWRIVYAGTYYNIVSIIDPNMRHWALDLLCIENKG
jgi:SPP1 family predicted phage head-tail adaptor